MRLLTLTATIFLMISAGCKKEEPGSTAIVIKTENSATIEAIEKTGQLWGIEEVTLNGDSSVTLTDADSMEMGLGCGLFMSDVSDGVMNLRTGQSCLLTDGRHAFITYELNEIEENKLTFIVTDKFDARAFGDGIQIARKAVTISPYSKTMYREQ